MGDTFGLLSLPIPVPAAEKALSDPALDLVLDFLKTVLNAYLTPGWAVRSPADPIPVRYAFPYKPDPEVFNADETPALFLWRSDSTGKTSFSSQDVISDEDGISGLWVPPPQVREDKRLRDSILNGFKKVINFTLLQGRDPSWKLAGDTYYNADDFGSVLLHHTKLGRCILEKVQTHTLMIESHDRTVKMPFESIFFTLDTLETWQEDITKYTALNKVTGTMFLGDPSTPLAVLPFEFNPSVTSIDPVTGDAAGGETVTITGAQFPTDLDEDVAVTVLFGDQAVIGTVSSETEITAVTPAHTSGIVDVTVVFPSGVAKILPQAFTFVGDGYLVTENGDFLVTENDDYLVT